MSRDFTGSNNSTQVSRTLGAAAPPTSGAFSVGCWTNVDTWATGRTLVGTSTSDANMSGLLTGSATAQRFRLKVNCATTDMVVEVAAPATGAWICAVGVYNNSLTATNNTIWTGSVSSPMASQAHVTDTNGSGAVSGSTSATIGKNSGSNTTHDGRIGMAFWVPWAMTADEIERYRQGDWSALFRGGTPTFFVPMEGGSAAAYDLAVPGNWTIGGTPTVSEDPPIAFGLKANSIRAILVKEAAAQPVSGSISTLTGALTAGHITAKSLSGAFT